MLGPCWAQDPYCPKSIHTKQTIESAPPGWKAANGKGEHSLAAITLFDGPPEQEASLVYDSYIKGKTADRATWKFDPSQHIWISCIYQGTEITLAKPLSEKTTECRVSYSRSIHIDGYQQIEQIDCK
jgi:hypothetical protein